MFIFFYLNLIKLSLTLNILIRLSINLFCFLLFYLCEVLSINRMRVMLKFYFSCFKKLFLTFSKKMNVLNFFIQLKKN